MHIPELTPSQLRILTTLCDCRTHRYNGRAQKALQKLKALGLIELDYEIVLRAIGHNVDRYTAQLAVSVSDAEVIVKHYQRTVDAPKQVG